MPTTRRGKGGKYRKSGKNETDDEKGMIVLNDGSRRVLRIHVFGELPESSRLNEGIDGGLDEEDEGAGETWFKRNSRDSYSSDIKTSELQPQAEIKEMKKKGIDSPPKKQKTNKDSSTPELQPQAEIKEMKKKGNDSPPCKKQKKNKDSSTSSSTPEIDDNPAVAAETTMIEAQIEALPVEAEVRPDSESYFINEAGNLQIPPGRDISLRDDPFNKFGLVMSQYIHSQNDADYYASLSLPKFTKHFHNQVMIVNRMASHLGHSINKVLQQKEDLENDIKTFEFAKNDALKRINLLQEEVATIEAARNKAIANALAETKEFLSASTASVQGRIAETTELKVEIAELKKQLEESRASQASTSTKLSPDEILKLFEGTTHHCHMFYNTLKQGFELFRKGACGQPLDPAAKAIIEELDFDKVVDVEFEMNSDSQ